MARLRLLVKLTGTPTERGELASGYNHELQLLRSTRLLSP